MSEEKPKSPKIVFQAQLDPEDTHGQAVLNTRFVAIRIVEVEQQRVDPRSMSRYGTHQVLVTEVAKQRDAMGQLIWQSGTGDHAVAYLLSQAIVKLTR